MGSLFLRISNIEILLFLNYIWIIGFKFVLGNRVDYLLPTIQVSNKINPNETFLYYFFSYEELDNFFSFHSIDGKSMIYAHYNTESLPFTISSAEIYKYYLSTGFFITPKVIHNFLHLELKVTNPNGFFLLPQWVVIVFCQEKNILCQVRYLNISLASSFLTVSCTVSTSTLTSLFPKLMVIMSPTLTSTEAFATLSLIITRPASQASFATVRLLISLDTFKYLSNLI